MKDAPMKVYQDVCSPRNTWRKTKSGSFSSPPPSHELQYISVTSGFTRLSMKTKYVCRDLISLYVHFHSNRTMWSTNLHVKICRWGGKRKKRPKSLKTSVVPKRLFGSQYLEKSHWKTGSQMWKKASLKCTIIPTRNTPISFFPANIVAPIKTRSYATFGFIFVIFYESNFYFLNLLFL